MPGPVPNRSDQRRRRNKVDGGITSGAGAPVVPVPLADEGWHPVARAWFDSLVVSGQSAFYEPSDWATAVFVAEAMSRNLSAGRFSAQLFAAVMAGMTELLTTEGARRRARVELQRDPAVDVDGDAAVASMSEWRDRLGAS